MAIKIDTFTEVSDTPLENHTSDSGGSWLGEDTTNFDIIASTDEVSYDGLGDELGISGGGVAIGAESPPGANYYVEITGKLGTSAGDNRVGAVLRYVDTNNGYYFRHLAWDGICGIYKYVGGVQSELASSTFSIDVDTYYTWKFQINGNVLKLYRNSIFLLEATDSSITAAGKAGLLIGGTDPRITSITIIMMAINNAEKRRSISGIGWLIPGVTPNSSKDWEWRQEAGWNYSGIPATVSVIVFVISPRKIIFPGEDRAIRAIRDDRTITADINDN